MTLAEKARDAGRRIHTAPFSQVGPAINAGIAEVIGSPFSISSGQVVDATGQTVGPFASVVHTNTKSHIEDGDIAADDACAVIDVVDSMGLEELVSSYTKVSKLKRLEKTPRPDRSKSRPAATVTMTVIFACRLKVPLDVIAEHLQRLNEVRPHSEWVDMVAVSGIGVVSYACQLAGQTTLGGILPPARDASRTYSPAWYVIPTMSATGEGTFNRVLSFVVSYTTFFSPGVTVPNFNDFLIGVCPNVVTMKGYQPNLAGDLLPFPRAHYADQFLPQRPMLVEEKKSKELLASLQFLPWQDGGVILLKGKLPLEGLMVFLGKDGLKKGGVMRTGPDTQTSYVQPINAANFEEMMTRLRNQSNMSVRRAVPKFTMEKMADEGTSTPFMARIFMGLLHVREAAYPDPRERLNFDKIFEQTLSPLLAARTAGLEIQNMWSAHLKSVAAGEVARIQDGSITISGDFNRGFRKEVHSFIYDAAKAFKGGLQKTGKSMGAEIGFMFLDDGAYQRGLAKLRETDPQLAAYLQRTREVWSQKLILTRNNLDHGGWALPRVTYEIQAMRVVARQPEIEGMPAVDFVMLMLDRLSCFTEEFTAHCFKSRMPTGITIVEIPLVERPREAAERFSLTLSNGGLPEWQLAYSDSPFEQI